MTENFPVKDLDHLLEETLGPGLTIESVVWKPLTEPGENYGSLIYAVDATVARKNITEVLNLVVKLPPPTPYLTDLFNSPVSFWKEIVFYKEISPKFLELQLKIQNSTEEDNLANLIPRYYGGRLGLENAEVFDGQAAIVLENLVPMGYAVQDRLRGLDLEHSEFAVRELAKFHAITIGIKTKMPKFFETTVIPALIHTANDPCRAAVMDMVRKAHDMLKNLTEAKPYLDHVDRTLKYDYEVDYRTIKPSEPWGTMGHNDFWCNNMLFKYNDDNKPIGIKIVDFQLGIYTSGAMDLIFFLISSLQESVLDNNLDDLINLYYKSFLDNLTLLKIDTEAFTLKEYNKEINKCAPLKLGQCIMMINVIKAEKGAVKNLADRDNGEILVGEKIVRKLLHTLKIFDKKRWFLD